MSVRVGRIVKGKHPSFEGFIPIVVMTKSSKYGEIGPYCLKNEFNQIMENKFQFSKLYSEVPETTQTYSRWDPRVIWDWPAQIHLKDGEPTEDYWKWREAGMNAAEAIRYPVGTTHRHKCLYALTDDGHKLDYVEGRKQIYLPEYVNLAKKHPTFHKLQKWLKEGKNLLIIEIDGPHQEDLQYYKDKYDIDDDFIVQNTMIANEENLEIMLNDTKNPYGHSYCLAGALLGIY